LLIVSLQGLDRIFFWNGGADAVEAAWKLARHATGKKNIIVMQGSYHGRTFATMGMTTSKTIYSAGFGPFVPGVHVAPFPFCLHCHASASCGSGKCCNNPLKQIELLFKQQTAPNDTAAIILEPVLGEGGYVPPPKGYLTKLRELCTKNNVLLIADEVQTGFGRTGKYFAVQHEDVVPDILVFAKGIANGHVLSGIASTYDLMQKQPPGSMGGTFAGNAVSCAAACATLDVLERDKILDNVNARAPELREGLLKIQKQFPDLIRDVRGQGLMIGVEFSETLSYAFANEVSKMCLHQGMLLLTTSTFPVVRFIPPLNVTTTEIHLALDIFAEAVRLAGSRRAEFAAH
jgi:4-aminobutyrate aminotransferase